MKAGVEGVDEMKMMGKGDVVKKGWRWGVGHGWRIGCVEDVGLWVDDYMSSYDGDKRWKGNEGWGS